MSQTSSSRRLSKKAIAGLLLLVLLVAGGFAYFLRIQQLGAELGEAMDEADRLDPGWRLSEMHEKRPHVPDAENAVNRIYAAKALSKPTAPKEDEPALPPNQLMSAARLARLREEMKDSMPAVNEARGLAGMPRGRFLAAWDANWMTVLLPASNDVRWVVRLLSEDALLQAQENHPVEAFLDCTAMLNAAKTLEDLPSSATLVVRCACRAMAGRRIEGVLALTEPSEASLFQMQKQLRDEELAPAWLVGARGERAFGDITIQALMTSAGAPLGGLQDFMGTLVGNSMSTNRARLIRSLTQLVEIAKSPIDEQRPRVKELTAQMKTEPMLVTLLAPALEQTFDAYLRSLADLRCAQVIIALERFRKKEGRWPESIEQLTPQYLDQVPRDPFDGKPLRFLAKSDVLVFYSIGIDGKDDGGVHDDGGQKSADIVYRLWDVKERRKPAGLAAKKLD